MDITIEYCTEWFYLPDAASLQNAIKDKYGIESKLIEGSGGAFEVRIDGTLIFSKLRQFRFPEEDEIFAAIDRARSS